VRTFVLWDIDGTLLDAGRIAHGLYNEAFRAVIGEVPADGIYQSIKMGGRTDHDITLELLERHGVSDGRRHLPAFTTALADALASKVDEVREKGRVLPGVPEVLAALDARPEVLQSLLTGNVEPNAGVKLAAFGLERWVDLEVGGYGSDDHRRPFLVDIARAKAERKYGHAYSPDDTVLIGDTPLDVAAAREGRARVVAVATGNYGRDELEAAGADVVLDDLSDTDKAVAAILNG
jgi:phosphoglycolate phosphatase-like HAD superfamily hydrolase